MSDSRFFQAWTMAADLVVLNVLMALTGLPLLTGGAVLTAGLAVCLQMVSGTSGKPLTEYFRAFGRVFLPATVIWIAEVGLAALMFWEWAVTGQLASPVVALFARAILLLAGLLLGLTSIWFWPLLAKRVVAGDAVRMDDLIPLLKTALFAGLKYLPRSLVAVAIVVVPYAFAATSVDVGSRMLFWFAVIGMALACYLVMLVLRTPLGITLPDVDE